MSSDEIRFRKFMTDARERALEIADQSHVTAEARNVIKDFIEISHQTEKLLSDRTESSVDQRILQKRYEALKIEARENINRLAKLKDILTTELAPILKSLSVEANLVADRGQKSEDQELQESANRTRAAVKKLIEVLSKV